MMQNFTRFSVVNTFIIHYKHYKRHQHYDKVAINSSGGSIEKKEKKVYAV